MKTRGNTGRINSGNAKNAPAILVNLNDIETTIFDGTTEIDDLKKLSVNDKSPSPAKVPRKSLRQRRGPVRYRSLTPETSPVIPKKSNPSDTSAAPKKRLKKTEDRDADKKGVKHQNNKKQNDQKMTDYERMIQRNIEARNAFLASLMKGEGDSFEEEKPLKKRKKHGASSNDEELETVPRRKRRKMAAKKKSYSDDEGNESEITYNTRSRESNVKIRGMYKEIGSSEDSVTENDVTLDTVSDNEDDEEYMEEARSRIKTRGRKRAKADRIVTRKFALLQQKREERKAKLNSKNLESDETEGHDKKIEESQNGDEVNATNNEEGTGQLKEENKENTNLLNCCCL